MKTLLASLGIGTAFRKMRLRRMLLCICVPVLLTWLALAITLLKENGMLTHSAGSDNTRPDIPDALVAPLSGYRYTPDTECVVEMDKPGGFILETGAFVPYSGTSDPMQDAAWQARSGVDVVRVPPPPAIAAPRQGGESEKFPTAAFAGASTFEIKEEDWGKTPLVLMRDFLTANPAKGGLPVSSGILRGPVLDNILAASALPAPAKGRVSILPSGPLNEMSFAFISNRPPRRYWLVRTLNGRVGLLQTIDDFTGKQRQLAIRWKLLEQNPAPEATAPAAPAEFRCLAWLDEVRSTPDWRAWSIQGVLLDRNELQLPDWLPAPSQQDLAKVDTGSLYACFWFYCPGADPLSFADVRILNASSRPQTDPADPANTLNISAARMQDRNSGWIISTQYMGRRSTMPPWAYIQLRYSSGPWQTWHYLPPGFSGKMPIENGDHVTRTGQTDDDRSFVELTRTPAEEDAVDPRGSLKIGEQIDFVANTNAGHTLTRTAITSTPGPDNTTIDRYIFDVPLNHVASFQGRTRPIWHLTVSSAFGRSLSPYVHGPTFTAPTEADYKWPAEFAGASWADQTSTGFDWRISIFDSDLAYTSLLQPMLLPPPAKRDLDKAAAGGAQPLCLNVWFYQPALDTQSLVDISLLDENDLPLSAPQDAQSALNATAVSPRQGVNGGWIMARFYAGRAGKPLTRVRARLRYSAGPWQQGADIAPDSSNPIPLETGVRVTKTGHDNNGVSYIQVTRDKTADDSNTQFDFVAIAPDNSIIKHSSELEINSPDGSKIERYFFETPPGGVKAFQGRARPVHTAMSSLFLPPRQ